MARRGQNIYQRKDGRWEGRFIKGRRADGKPKFSSVYGKTYSEVKKKLQEKIIEAAQMQEIKAEPKPSSFAAVAHSWLSFSRASCKESTSSKYTYMLERHILPCFGRRPTSAITKETLEKFVVEKLVSGRLDGSGGLSPKTVADILAIIKQILRHAGVAAPAVKVRNPVPEMAAYSAREQQRLVAFLGQSNDLCKLGTLLCLHTGIRVGELCGLRWRDIDLRENVLHIRGTMQRVQDQFLSNGARTKVIITEPKSSCSVRGIPLPIWLVKKLRAVQCANPGAYFLTGSSDSFIEPRNMQYKFKGYQKSCGVKSLGFHALRHTFATRCVENGFELKSLSEILGHSNVNITLNRYVHSSMDLKRQQMERMSEFF